MQPIPYTYVYTHNFLGSSGSDYIYGTNKNNLIYGSSAHDTIYGFDGNDIIYGGAGNDSLYGGNGNDKLYGGWGNDIFYTSGNGVDFYYGDAGDDTFMISSTTYGGNDIYGGTGNDTIDFSFSNVGKLVSLNIGFSSGGGIHFESIENVRGSSKLDVIHGSAYNNRLEGLGGDDQLYGGDGKDTLDGGEGDDLLVGGAGADLLRGGSGADTFVFDFDEVNKGNWGTILDFSGSQGDKIDLSEVVDGNSINILGDDQTFIGDTEFSGTGDSEVRVVRDGAYRATIYVDTNGDGQTNGTVNVNLTSSFEILDNSDFIF